MTNEWTRALSRSLRCDGPGPSAAWPQKHIYFARSQATGLIKIGSTANVRRRLIELKCEGGAAVELLAHTKGSMRLERELHRVLAADRRHGEWFAESHFVTEMIALARGGGLIPRVAELMFHEKHSARVAGTARAAPSTPRQE